MSAAKTLTEDEVSALLASLADTDDHARGQKVDPQSVQPFNFAGDDISLMGDLHALNAINERLGRHTRNLFQTFLRFQPRITALPSETKTLDEYIESLPPFVSLNTLRLEQLKGAALLTFRPELISLLVGRYFGGEGAVAVSRHNEFTPTEERITRLVSERLAEHIHTSWRDVMELDVTLMGTETNPAFVALCEGTDLVLVSSFAVQIPQTDPLIFDICYTLQSLKPIAPLLRSKINSNVADEDNRWREKLHEAVLNIGLTVRPRLTQITISLSHLLDLAPDMVINIPPVDDVSLYIEEQLYAQGVLGEVAGSAAVKITKILEE